MFLIIVKNLNIILVVYLVKKLIINNVAYTSKGSGVYVQWGWRIHPMGVAYTSNRPIRPKGRYYNINVKFESKSPKILVPIGHYQLPIHPLLILFWKNKFILSLFN